MAMMLDDLMLVEETVTYVDGPMDGYAKGPNGNYFAFRRYPVIADVLFHWVLVPVESVAVDVDTVFRNTRTTPPRSWVSILEDMRTEKRAVYEATLGPEHHIPLDWE